MWLRNRIKWCILTFLILFLIKLLIQSFIIHCSYSLQMIWAQYILKIELIVTFRHWITFLLFTEEVVCFKVTLFILPKRVTDYGAKVFHKLFWIQLWIKKKKRYLKGICSHLGYQAVFHTPLHTSICRFHMYWCTAGYREIQMNIHQYLYMFCHHPSAGIQASICTGKEKQIH